MNYTSKTGAWVILCILCHFSCQPYEPYTREEVFKGAYARNFARTFGDIDPARGWDFADEPLVYEPPVQTRSAADDLAKITDSDGYFLVDQSLFAQVTEQTKTSQVTDQSFAFLIGENACFEIFPVYLTSSSSGRINWSLQMLVDNQNVIGSSGTDYPGWKMGEQVQVRTSYTGSWGDFLSGSVCREYGLRSKPIIHYTNDGGKKLMHLALHISTENKDIEQYAIPGSQQSCLHYQMRILNIPQPARIGSNLQTLFVACEASDVEGSLPTQRRYRSLVLMIVGPSIPQVLYVRKDRQGNGWVDYEGNGKRYMIEDLGSASDFDFNDVVVDVEQASSAPVLITQESPKNTNAKLTTASLGSPQAQEARANVSFLCGTLPFRLSVGGHTFGLVTNPTDEQQTRKQLLQEALDREATYFKGPMEIHGWEPGVQAVIPDWDPSSNQVSIEVWPNGTQDCTQGGWTAQFPQRGEVPFMMALPTSTPWNPEGVPFTEWKRYIPLK